MCLSSADTSFFLSIFGCTQSNCFLNFYLLLILCLHSVRTIGLTSKVFANGLGDQGSIPGRVIPKTKI